VTVNNGSITIPATFQAPTDAFWLTLSPHGVPGPVTGPTSIDGNVTGTGLNQFRYDSNWGLTTGVTDMFQGTANWSHVANATATFQFSGTQVALHAVRDIDQGIMTVSIDGGAAQSVDDNASSRNASGIVWTSPLLPAGTHTLTIVNTGTHNSASSGINIAIDRVEVQIRHQLLLLIRAGAVRHAREEVGGGCAGWGVQRRGGVAARCWARYVLLIEAEPVQILLEVDAGPDGDAGERAELGLRLRDELVLADVESVDPASGGELPGGAKGGDSFAWGSLVVTLVSSGALTALIGTVNSWLGRQRRGSVSVRIGDDELVLTSAAPEEQRRLVEEWLGRHGSEPFSGG
jgi:Effector Associated Constant Component 1